MYISDFFLPMQLYSTLWTVRSSLSDLLMLAAVVCYAVLLGHCVGIRAHNSPVVTMHSITFPLNTLFHSRSWCTDSAGLVLNTCWNQTVQYCKCSEHWNRQWRLLYSTVMYMR